MLIAFLLLLGLQNAAFAALEAIERQRQVAEDFRDAYPYHLQIIGATPQLSDNSRVVIVSEPPPNLSLSYFQNLAGSVEGSVTTFTHSVGYDGWTKDVVIALPPLPQPVFDALLTRLHQDLYGTSYKAHAVSLPIGNRNLNSVSLEDQSLDLTVSAGNLYEWFINNPVQFSSLSGGETQTLPGLLASQQPGVFLSDQAGFVAWVIPRNGDLNQYQVAGRQFFLDSDLILGAIASGPTIAIIGRERVKPVLQLPPLRFETALVLAAEDSGELSQSYERNHLFSGKLTDGNDWAPIYLSERLVNTEFGSLLNITDQLLKSWSLGGSVDYINFNYPQPSGWASFPYPMRELYIQEEIDSILFNWNTAGLGYTAEVGPYEVFALNRTGALPLTYGFDSDLAAAYEEVAYDYFAQLSNPDLARVVQYTALYQIFDRFGISTQAGAPQGSLQPGYLALSFEALVLIESLKTVAGNPEAIDGLAAYDPALQEKFLTLMALIEEGEALWPDEALLNLSAVIASPRLYFSNAPDDTLTEWTSVTYYLFRDPYIQYLFSLFLDLEGIKDRYTAAFREEPPGWIKTPSIVLSRDTIDASSVGGHNLDAGLTQLIADPGVSVGRPEIGGNPSAPIIYYNPQDLGRIHPLSRQLSIQLETATDEATLLATLQRTIDSSSEPAAPIPRALRLSNQAQVDHNAGFRGLTARLMPESPSGPLGWQRRQSAVNDVEQQRLAAVESLRQPAIIVEKLEDRFQVFQSGRNQVLEAYTINSLYDEALSQALRSMPAGAERIQLYFIGMTPQEQRGLLLTSDMKQRVQQVAVGDSNSLLGSMDTLNRSYNWENAVVRDVRVTEIAEGPYSGYVDVDVEVPPTTPERPSLFMRFRAFFTNVSSSIRNRIPQVIQNILAGSSSRSRNVNDVIFDVRQGLEREYPDVNIDVQLEAGDIYITEPGGTRIRLTLSTNDGD